MNRSLSYDSFDEMKAMILGEYLHQSISGNQTNQSLENVLAKLESRHAKPGESVEV
jgi:hypothetical protein